MSGLTTFRVIASEFAAKTDDEVNAMLSLASLRFNVTLWGTLYELGAAYMAAHMFARDASGSTGGGGPVQSTKARDLSITYAASASASAGGMDSTPYGQDYLALRDQLAVTPQVIA